MTYGNGLVETSAYNNRLQPSQLRTYNPTNNTDILNLSYGFTNSAGANNGNVVNFTSTATQIFMRSYSYDELNRLSTMSSPADTSGCYGLSWTYDAWANRASQNVTSGGCYSPSQIVLANNRISGYSYDAAGNMTHDASHIYTYDAENRLTQVDGGSTATYLYDAEGRRVRKTTGGTSVDYTYDLSGNVTGEWMTSSSYTGPSAHYGYANGSLVAEYENGTTYFFHKDHLGSTRVMTKLDGSVYDSMDYLPYGEQIAGGTGTTHKFTGKERDAESGLDNFGFRYDSSNLGRFMSPDPLMASARASNPQTWNRYTYTLNNPLRFVDPDGLAEESADDCKKDNKCVTVKVNVVYDGSANDGKGLTDEQKKKFEQGALQEAKNEYGDAHIHLDVNYSKDIVKDSINVLVTDNGDSGVSGITKDGAAVSRINVNQADNETFSHELAHHFLGDTTGTADRIAQRDSTGILGAVFNTFADIANDDKRHALQESLGVALATRGPSGIRSAQVAADSFNSGAAKFVDKLNQQAAIRPQQ